MKKLFGTDGMRGIAGEFPLDGESVFALGKALAGLLAAEGLAPRILIGRDTRESGSWLESALVAGIKSGRGKAVSAGVIPTSAVSLLVARHGFAAGAVISASHNPYRDNGIKIFSSRGIKISDEWEARLEDEVLAGKLKDKRRISISTVRPEKAYWEDYASFLRSRLGGPSHGRKLRLVLDCAHGASSDVAPRVFKDLGFEVEVTAASPDGKNINDGCGSLHPEPLARRVRDVKADIGIAYDGDADRALWADETGRLLNGDHTLYVQALFMQDAGRLRTDIVVATQMSNMGLEKALEARGIRFVRTRVGDKYVLEQMMALGASLGGEQSGHTIFLDDCPTGDGILTSIKMLEVMRAQDAPLSDLVRGFIEYPQRLASVRVARKADFNEFPEIVAVIEDIRARLKGTGRLDVRYSGTEPLARVMVEAEEAGLVDLCVKKMTDVIVRHLGA